MVQPRCQGGILENESLSPDYCDVFFKGGCC